LNSCRNAPQVSAAGRPRSGPVRNGNRRFSRPGRSPVADLEGRLDDPLHRWQGEGFEVGGVRQGRIGLGDPQGRVTTGLITATQYLKDNRLLPKGHQDTTTGPLSTAPVGVSDAAFVAGGATVRFELPLATTASRASGDSVSPGMRAARPAAPDGDRNVTQSIRPASSSDKNSARSGGRSGTVQ
jgi:hypothetical protein